MNIIRAKCWRRSAGQKSSEGESLPQIIIQKLVKKQKLINSKVIQDELLSFFESEEIKENIKAYQSEINIAKKRLFILKERQKLSKQQLEKTLSLQAKDFVSEGQILVTQEKHLQLKADIQAVIKLNNMYKQTQSRLLQSPIKARRLMIDNKHQLLDLEQNIIELNSRESYSIKSTINGKVTSIQSKTGQMVTSKHPLLAILPDDAKYQAELFIPSRAIGFIESGKQVMIRYDAFPYQQFGLYQGSISDISGSIFLPGELPVPVILEEPVYRVKVILKSQFVTAFSKQLTLQSGMLLDADIILEKRTFVEWLFEPLFSLKSNI